MQADPSVPIPDPASAHPAFDPKQGACLRGSIAAHQLFQGRQEILIDHHGETYRLRITRNGKLILTK